MDGKALIELAYTVAKDVHAGQTRNDGKTPYITHPKAVSGMFNHPEMIAVSLLHDVLEDSNMTPSDLLKQGFPDEVVEAVAAITKIPKESYLDYILRVKKNHMARLVKMEDIIHNRKTSVGHKKSKYDLALYILFFM